MKDRDGDKIEVGQFHDWQYGKHVEVAIASGVEECAVWLTPKQARKIAKRLVREADAIEAGQ